MKIRDLRDVTFIIPFGCDSPERTENLKAILRFLTNNFATNVLVVEDIGMGVSGFFVLPHSIVQHIKINFRNDGVFHRTKVINYGIRMAGTRFICIFDTDCFFELSAMELAVNRLRHENYQMAYPYDGRFVNVDRDLYLINGWKKESESFAVDSVGGAVFIDRIAYVEAGMENENVLSWGPEDSERFSRMKILGYNYTQIKESKCYHITHPVNENSSAANPYTAENNAEYEKVKSMSKPALEEYIKTWEWAKA